MLIMLIVLAEGFVSKKTFWGNVNSFVAGRSELYLFVYVILRYQMAKLIERKVGRWGGIFPDTGWLHIQRENDATK